MNVRKIKRHQRKKHPQERQKRKNLFNKRVNRRKNKQNNLLRVLPLEDQVKRAKKINLRNLKYRR